ncbi:hypothetical protein ABZ920_09495 [Streptomyces sp. NPDC046831]|uniref:hypothetical protein n=1 Tax=Streptomyces sp. NPDC046831 TaxID=3154805 RepID=UPI0033C02B54
MARHLPLPRTTARRALVAFAAAGAAVGAGATTAGAVPAQSGRPASAEGAGPQTGLPAVTGPVGHVTGPVADMRPNPLAETGADPLDNGVETQIADFRPVNTRTLTGPVAQAPSVRSVPVAGPVTRSLGGGAG